MLVSEHDQAFLSGEAFPLSSLAELELTVVATVIWVLAVPVEVTDSASESLSYNACSASTSLEVVTIRVLGLALCFVLVELGLAVFSLGWRASGGVKLCLLGVGEIPAKLVFASVGLARLDVGLGFGVVDRAILDWLRGRSWASKVANFAHIRAVSWLDKSVCRWVTWVSACSNLESIFLMLFSILVKSTLIVVLIV